MNCNGDLGRSVLMTGVFDLALTEMVLRLVRPGDVVVDAGANIGYISALAVRCAAPAGRVISFEPNPQLLDQLRQNVLANERATSRCIGTVHAVALGEIEAHVDLVLPIAYSQNEGLAHIRRSDSDEGAVHRVPLARLDSYLVDQSVQLLKLDVEGSELGVLKGARNALVERRIRHIVYEDHEGPGSETSLYLEGLGYTIFVFGWSILGLIVAPKSAGRLAQRYEAPNYIATLDPDECLSRCAPRGWRALRPI